MQKLMNYVVLALLLLASAVAGAGYSLERQPPPSETAVSPLINLILDSNSATAYQNRAVDDRTIALLIKCGIKAPSARNQQPWYFTVIKNQELLNRMAAETSKPQAASQSKHHLFYRAPVVILISATANSQFAVFDAALACQNISLAAQSMGLGTRIVAGVQALFEGPKGKEYRKLLGIPEGKTPLVALTLGWPANPPEAVTGATTRNPNVVNYIK